GYGRCVLTVRTRFVPAASSRQQDNPFPCSTRKSRLECVRFSPATAKPTLGSTRTLLPGSRSGKARASSRPILAYRNCCRLACSAEPWRVGGPASNNWLRGATGGIGVSRDLLRNQEIKALGSLREESRRMVRFVGIRS